jgi:branched-chain amino acid aminotransferase
LSDSLRIGQFRIGQSTSIAIILETESMLFYVNDRLVPAEKAAISAMDRGFIYGDGIFETLLLHNGAVFRVMEHLKRLEESASIVRIRLPWTRRELAGKIYETVRGNSVSEALIRVNVSRGVGSWRLTVKGALSPTLVISLYAPEDPPAGTYTKGWPVIISKSVMVIDPVIPGRAKTTNRLNLILAKNEAEEKGAMEAILLNRNGHLTEGTSTNFFFCSGGRLHTPSPESGILRGVTRDLVINIARAIGIDFTEGFFAPEDLLSADEAFLTFTTLGVVPICSVDGTILGEGRKGPVTARIAKEYEALLEKETLSLAGRG